MRIAKSITFLVFLFSCSPDEDVSFSLDPILDNIIYPQYKSNFNCKNCGENLNSFVLNWDIYTSLENSFISYEVLFGEESKSILPDELNESLTIDNLSSSQILDNVIHKLTLDDGTILKDTITAFTKNLPSSYFPEENAIKTTITDNGQSINTINWINSTELQSETNIYRFITQDAGFIPELDISEDLIGWNQLSITGQDVTSITDEKESSNDIHFYILKTTLEGQKRYSTIKRDINLTSTFQHTPNFSASNNRNSKIMLSWNIYDQNDFYSYDIWKCFDESCDEDSATHIITIIDKNISNFSYNAFLNRGKTIFFKLNIKTLL